MKKSIIEDVTTEEIFKKFGEMRVACPMKIFAARKISFCQGCSNYKGFQKVMTSDDEIRIDNAGRMIKVICQYPMARRIAYFPED